MHRHTAGSCVHRGTAPIISCMTVWRHGETHRHNRTSEPQPPQPPHSSFHSRVALSRVASTETRAVDAVAGVDGAGAARQRRERRLRAHLRYARMSVATALAEATHHTAPRGQRTARVRREENELNFAMGQMTPPPRRPTPLVENMVDVPVVFVVLTPQFFRGGDSRDPTVAGRRAFLTLWR